MKILIGLSGWVDSAVAAYLLKEQWHEVVWGFMKNYSEESGTCTTREDAESAIEVAKFLGIELQVFDFEKEYEERILNYIFEGYSNWITPNPDILCNNLVKFDLFLDAAIKLGFDKIAMGHYARIKSELGRDSTPLYKLYRWRDHNKDQSYFLSWLNQYQLSKALFPLWVLEKPKVRSIAKTIWLPNADRKDSQGLCFVWNVPIKDFLMKKLPVEAWNIVDEAWNILWQHDGAWFFTIGQNRWLKLNHKAYVYNIDVKNNVVYVSKDKEAPHLKTRKIQLKNWHWIAEEYPLVLDCEAKIRYRQEVQPCRLEKTHWKIFVIFDEEQWAVAPGQTIVVYLDEECVWAGIIV